MFSIISVSSVSALVVLSLFMSRSPLHTYIVSNFLMDSLDQVRREGSERVRPALNIHSKNLRLDGRLQVNALQRICKEKVNYAIYDGVKSLKATKS